MTKALQTPKATAAGWWDRWWPYVLDSFLTLWVLRAPVATLLVGCAILGLVPQAQDLLVELATPGGFEGWWRIAVFFMLLTFVWAMPTHYAARLLVRTDERYLEHIRHRKNDFILCLQTWMPRLLGAATFVAMMGSAWRSGYNLPAISDVAYRSAVVWKLTALAVGIAFAMAVFVCYTMRRDKIAALGLIAWFEDLLSGPMAVARQYIPSFTTGARQSTDSDLGPVLLLVMFLGFALTPIAFPMAFAEAFPRATAVPFVIGGWMPLLAYLAGLGRRLHAPLITFGLLLLTIIPLFTGDNYPVRKIDSAAAIKTITGVDGTRNTAGIGLEQAVTLWKSANCDGAGRNCPRPIIVAAAGGASRAGFFTAGVIGQLLDDQLRIEGNGHGLTSEQMTNRIFALSTVSGSSLGAVMTVAALAASDGGRQPCIVPDDALWHGQKITDWRSCLEALMAGDFLTPAFTGFVFHDTFNFLAKLSHRFVSIFEEGDRGALLEESWELRFKKIVGARENGQSGLRCRGNLECPFITLVPTAKRWLPLLLLNGTSVGSGQRIITTMLNWSDRLGNNNVCTTNQREPACLLFQRTEVFGDMLRDSDTPLILDDVRLSTAAHNSARFPLISPPGEIRDNDDVIVDRIVDGGYFENFGAQTATELAEAVSAIDKDLRPFILVLSNDPEVLEKQQSIAAAKKAAKATKDAPIVRGQQASWLTDITGPLKAFANTRNARGTLAVDDAEIALDRVGLQGCNLSWIRVWSEPKSKNSNQPRELSMSWWLSKPVQIYLHEQTEFELKAGSPSWKPTNEHRNEARIRYLLDAIAGNPARNVPVGYNPCDQEY